MSLFDDFQELRAPYTAAPFWFWNDDLDPDEIRRQVREMHAQNVRGFFIHARVGRVTPYMSDRWMECVKAAVDEADGLGMRAWIYDEDNWPSGYAGGAICALGDDVLQRYALGMEIPLDGKGGTITIPEVDGLLAVYVLRKDGDRVHAIEALPESAWAGGSVETSGLDGEALLAMRREIYRDTRYFCPEVSADGYVDVMNPDVIAKFIAHTYEGYRKVVGEYFGRTIPGFFVDEPSYHDKNWGSREEMRTPWTERLPEVYRDFNGRDLYADLPLLFYETGDYLKVRHDYYRLITRLFAESFTKQIADWCAAHGVACTGHYILEECLRAAVQTIGNAMEHYEYQQAPGIDHLGQYLDLAAFWSSSRVLCKQAGSVAHQFGRETVMCETYAGGGWDFGALEQKWMGDWMIALGVTLICPHAFHYSLRGYRKRDYPPSLGYQQPWFPMSGDLGAHFARLNWILTRGEHVTEVAVLHPMDSIRATHNVLRRPWEYDPYTDNFKAITRALLDEQIDFDYVDEELLSRHGSVEDGRLAMNRCRYRVLVVPHLLTIRRTTLDLVRRFLAAGGRVLVTEPWPGCVEAVESAEPDAVFAQATPLGQWHSPESRAALIRELREAVDFTVLLSCPEHSSRHVVYQHRRTEEADILFFASEARESHAVIAAIKAGPGRVAERWDTVTGGRTTVATADADGNLVFPLTFDFGHSHVIVVPKAPAPQAEVAETIETLVTEWPVGSPIPARLDSANNLVLDHPQLSFDGSDWTAPMRLFDAHTAIAKAVEGGASSIRVRYAFTSRADIAAPISLLVETPESLTMSLDGQAVEGVDTGWFADISLRRVPLTNHLAKGGHELVFAFGPGVELEPCYLQGRFGVYRDTKGVPVIGDFPEEQVLGDWCPQGLLFYTGCVSYDIEFDWDPMEEGEPWLVFPRVSKTVAVEAGDRIVGTALWPPYEVSLAGAVAPGINRVRVTVANSLRNFYGPHHLKGEEDIDCLGPGEVRERRRYTPEFITKPAGLLAGIQLVRRTTA